MVGVELEVLDLLLAVQHLPALDAEHLAVGLLLDLVESLNERVPLGRIPLNHIEFGC